MEGVGTGNQDYSTTDVDVGGRLLESTGPATGGLAATWQRLQDEMEVTPGRDGSDAGTR